jgi:hypothetical protein
MPQSILPLYSICYSNEGASSLVSDVDRYVIIGKLLDYFQLLTVFICRLEISDIFAQEFSSAKLSAQDLTSPVRRVDRH